ncbi:hypothetical protein SUGI_1450210 [Cryptomeria japonica]|uniref:NB-ARC domain-containing protein n=1 Tax=Cryptomeria japonica TaxID=3369 RepID=A0AAD3NV45_CRYJA|nr:hypothetical protein SUGI_1450210 [Cryptomeria japonica]
MDIFNFKAVCSRTGKGEAYQYSFHNTLPVKSMFYVRLGKSIGDLKELLFQSDASIVGVHCMGGGGKTSLALTLCDDPNIKGCFRNIVFIIVSQSPNLKGILETIWEKIFRRNVPEFQNVEDAHIQLQQRLLKQSKPTLVVLDDVWSRANLEKLLFEARGYKTLVTTRDGSIIPRNPYTRLYQLPLLNKEDALSLFCLSAFGQTSIPSTADANLVIEVQEECKGLPLALKVVGSSLYREPHVAWENAKKILSLGESLSSYHSEGVFRCLETSIDCLDDVGRTQATISYRCAPELSFSQHDVMRDLALYLGCQDSIVHRKRLLMPRKEHCLSEEWELLRDRQVNAQIVSIHTGSMAENDWYEMNLSKTEALVLHFSASEYFLPPFLKTMKKLKILIVCNLGSERSTIKGLDALSSLTQLRSVHLERLVAPTIPKQGKVIQNLDKLSLSLCEGFVKMSTFNDTNLQEFNLDHCSDLEELPLAMCHMPSSQSWSLTNCHLVEKLPYNIGNMSFLRMFRLLALPGLKELLVSIGKLEQLEFLDKASLGETFCNPECNLL